MTDTIRVLHVLAGGRHGGAETYALDAIQGLAAAGVAQHVICRPHPHYLETLRALGIGHDVLTFSALDCLLGRGRLIAERVRYTRATVVHAWMGRAASFIPAGIEVPVIGWFGGYYTLPRYRRCAFYIGVTRDIARHIAAASGRPQRTFVVHTFGTLPDDPPVDRAAFATPADRPLALCLARLHPKKGIDTLLRALARVPELYLWVAGEGPEGARYRALAQELGLGERVRFLGWRNDRKALLDAADLCVLPSRYEPFGTVIVEAWATQRPLVATKAAGAAQYVRDGHDGLLVEIDDVDDLARQMRRVIEEPGLGPALAAAGWQSYQQGFTREVSIGQLQAVYRLAATIGRGMPPIALKSLPIAALADQMAASPALAGWDADTRRRAAAAALAHQAAGLSASPANRTTAQPPGGPDAPVIAALLEAHGLVTFLGRRFWPGLARILHGEQVTPWSAEEFAIASERLDLANFLQAHAVERQELGVLLEAPQPGQGTRPISSS